MQRARTMRYAGGLLAAAAAFALGMGGARAQETSRVGVAAGVFVNVPEDQAVGICRALAGALEGELEVEVVVSEEAGLAEGCVTDAACLRELAERLEVEEVLVLVIVRVGERIRIEPTWADAATGTPQSRPPVNLNQGVERAGAIFADNAPRLLPDAEPRPKSASEVGAGDGEGDPQGATGGGTVGGSGAGGAASGAGGAAPGAGGAPIDRPRNRHLTTGTLVFGITGVALLTGAGLTGLLYSKPEDDSCDSGKRCNRGTLKAVNLAADLTALVGLGALGTATYLYWKSGERGEEREPAALRVGAGPGKIGVSLGGSF